MTEAVILEAQGISKHYGGINALDDVDLDLRRGEVLAIVATTVQASRP